MMKWMGEDRDDELWRVGFFLRTWMLWKTFLNRQKYEAECLGLKAELKSVR